MRKFYREPVKPTGFLVLGYLDGFAVKRRLDGVHYVFGPDGWVEAGTLAEAYNKIHEYKNKVAA